MLPICYPQGTIPRYCGGCVMAINFRCPNCRRTTPLQTTELCPCGNDLTKNRKFKVNVRFPNGQRRTKTVPDLKTAQKVEAKFKVQAIEHDVFNIKKFPTMKEVYDQYIKWAEHHKRSWKSDKERWHNHIAKNIYHQSGWTGLRHPMSRKSLTKCVQGKLVGGFPMHIPLCGKSSL